MTCGIYKITHRASGRCYIGQSRNIEKRWGRHRQELSASQPRLHAAMKKHGVAAFAFEVIETCKPEHLDAFEVVYIRTFKAADTGYNVERYPRGTGPVSDDTKRKIGDSQRRRQRERPATEETRRKLKEHRARQVAAGIACRQWSDEEKAAARRRAYIRAGMTEEDADEAMRKHADKRARAAYHKTPEGRAAHMKKMREAALVPAAIEKRNARMKAATQTDEHRAKQAARWTPDRKEKARIDSLARWDAMTEEEKKRCTESPR